jgi:hypothetical protein
MAAPTGFALGQRYAIWRLLRLEPYAKYSFDLYDFILGFTVLYNITLFLFDISFTFYVDSIVKYS